MSDQGNFFAKTYISDNFTAEQISNFFLNDQNSQDKHFSIITLFENHVKDTPESIAVIFNDQTLTYKDLNDKANSWASYLQIKGAKNGTLIGVCLERSLDLIICLLAILKVGGSYVPLDPSYPKDRLNFMIDDIGENAIIIVDKENKYRANRSNVVQIEFIKHTSNHCLVELPSEISAGDDIVSIIYTSGSTGQPKGVLNTHKGLINRLLWMKETYGFTKADTILHKTPFSFDVSVWELFLPLITGAKLVIALPGIHKDPQELVQVIQKNKVTIIHFVPSMLHGFLDYDISRNCKSLRIVFVSGEALAINTQNKFFKMLDIPLVNLYGPTEASIDVTHWHCAPDNEANFKSVPIGYSIWNTELYILDESIQEVPFGSEGELYIGGLGVAQGYLNRPDLTAERFITNPFDKSGFSNRLYRTGDKVRYLPNGALEFLGRLDHQVKIRGYRIELGEIESALSRQEDISQAIVKAWSEEDSAPQLVAYYLLTSEAKSKNETISHWEEIFKNSLKKYLPEYMMPVFWVKLDEMPLTPNGKIDRKALPALNRVSSRKYIAPRNVLEEKLAAIWQEVLGLDRVGIYDNFFEIGGDSISTIQIVSIARKQNILIKVKEIFQYPTIHDLTSNIALSSNILPKDNLQPVKGEVLLTPIQLYFFNLNLENVNHYNQSMLFNVAQSLDEKALNEALNYLYLYHDTLRLYFSKTSNGWKQFNAGPEVIKTENLFKIVDCISTNLLELNTYIEKTADLYQRSLNIEQGELLKVILFKTQTQADARLLIIFHHLIVDTVSWEIFIDDLETCYSQILDGKQAMLPTKTVSFQEWANRIHSYNPLNFKDEAQYWQEVSSISTKPFPSDFEFKATKEQSTRIEMGSLSLTMKDFFVQMSLKSQKYTIYDLLVTALAMTIADWCQDNSLFCNLESHGREEIFKDIDTSRTIGWFTAIYPVRISLSAPNDLGISLKEVSNALSKIPTKGLGYGILKYIKKESELVAIKHSPQIIFNFHGKKGSSKNKSKLFQVMNSPHGKQTCETNNRSYFFDINCYIEDDKFYIQWSYSTEQYRSDTIQKLLRNYIKYLDKLIGYYEQQTTSVISSFEFATGLQQSELDEILKKYNSEQIGE